MSQGMQLPFQALIATEKVGTRSSEDDGGRDLWPLHH